jgi:hypothetical protein
VRDVQLVLSFEHLGAMAGFLTGQFNSEVSQERDRAGGRAHCWSRQITHLCLSAPWGSVLGTVQGGSGGVHGSQKPPEHAHRRSLITDLIIMKDLGMRGNYQM